MRVQRNASSIVTIEEPGPSVDLGLLIPLIEKYKTTKGNMISDAIDEVLILNWFSF